MTVQVPTRLNDSDVELLDALVAEGVGDNRSDVIRIALRELHEAHRRRQIGEAIAASYRANPQSDDDVALALSNAIALTEAEPW